MHEHFDFIFQQISSVLPRHGKSVLLSGIDVDDVCLFIHRCCQNYKGPRLLDLDVAKNNADEKSQH